MVGVAAICHLAYACLITSIFRVLKAYSVYCILIHPLNMQPNCLESDTSTREEFGSLFFWVIKPLLYFLKFFFFFWWRPFSKSYWNCSSIASVFYVLDFWPWGMWDLNSSTGIKPTPPELEREVSTTRPPGKSRVNHYCPDTF